jgi:hypothetical protein
MAIRTMGPQTLTGNAQPLMGDVTTAAVVAAAVGTFAVITVANTALYQPGDRIILEPLTANSDAYIVAEIVSSTVLNCTPQGTPIAHVTSSIIQLGDAAIDVVVQPVDGGAGPVFIGSDNTITAVPAGNVIYRLDKTAAGTEGNAWHMAGGTDHNIVNTAEAWMVGTAGDKVYVYALVQ